MIRDFVPCHCARTRCHRRRRAPPHRVCQGCGERCRPCAWSTSTSHAKRSFARACYSPGTPSRLSPLLPSPSSCASSSPTDRDKALNGAYRGSFRRFKEEEIPVPSGGSNQITVPIGGSHHSRPVKGRLCALGLDGCNVVHGGRLMTDDGETGLWI